MISKKKQKTNQENAQKSTGPITAIGKAIVSQNARRHGIFAKEVMLTTGDGAENLEDFQAIWDGLNEIFQPANTLESLLVEKLAVDFWRLRRIIRFENGMLRSMLDNYRNRALDEHYDSKNNFLCFSSLDYLITPIRPKLKFYNLSDRISFDDVNRENTRLIVLSRDNSLLLSDHEFIEYVANTVLKQNKTEFDENIHKSVQEYIKGCSDKKLKIIQQEFLKKVSSRIDEMRQVADWNKRFEIQERQFCLPPSGSLEMITKYETSLERQITKKIVLLEAYKQASNKIN